MDFIADYMDYTDGIPSPDIFRLWSGIATIAGALERRVWISTSRAVLYPNLFVLLVAPPGVGKTQAIATVSDLWYASKKFHVAPDNMTKAALIDAIRDASTKRIIPSGLFEYNSLLTAADEFGVLVPAHDLEFLSVLNKIFDNPRSYRENRRHMEVQVEITNPQLNIIAGTQPGFMASLLPEESWSMGFTSRLLMIYSATPSKIELFAKQEDRGKQYRRLVSTLERYSDLLGEMEITQEAKDRLQSWATKGCEPVPQHSKLQHYVPRRIIYVLKLAMISAVSRTGMLCLELPDVERALTWLLFAEKLMPDIFRDMTLKSDSQVIEELHFFLWQLFMKENRPIHETRAIHFLQQRLPAEKIERVLGIAVKSGILEAHSTTIGPAYVPVASHKHGTPE